MAAIAGDLTQKILGHSDADKAFRPWWDNLEDGVLYTFVIMGVITLPMTFISNTPIECTIHQDLWFSDTFTLPNKSVISSPEFSLSSGSQGKASVRRLAMYLRSYSKKYCTETHVSPFLLYYSFCLFLVPGLLIFIEKTFVKIYDAESRTEVLYSILKDSLKTEDVAKMENETTKNSHEVFQALRNSRGLHDSYLYRTALELVASGILMLFFAQFGEIDGISSAMFDCHIHGVPFKCVIPNHRFFMVIYCMSVLLLFAYFLLTTYNLLWLVHSKVPRLERILSGCRRVDVEQKDKFKRYKSIHYLVVPREVNGPTKHRQTVSPLNRQKSQLKFMGIAEEAPEVRLDMYFDKETKDFRLMMNLLAERPGTDGLAQSFRLLTIFDKHFKSLWKPKDVRILDEDISAPNQMRPKTDATSQSTSADYNFNDFKEDEYEDTIWIAWNDCIMADYIAKRIPKCIIEYTVEVSPADQVETPVKSVMYHTIPDFYLANSDLRNGIDDGFSNCSSFELDNKFKYKIRFDASEIQGKDINITIATEFDGKTVTQVNFKEKIKRKGTNSDDIKDKSDNNPSDNSKLSPVNERILEHNKANKSVSFDIINDKNNKKINISKTHSAPVDPKEVKLRKVSQAAKTRSLEPDTIKHKEKEKYEILNEKQKDKKMTF